MAKEERNVISYFIPLGRVICDNPTDSAMIKAGIFRIECERIKMSFLEGVDKNPNMLMCGTNDFMRNKGKAREDN